MKKNKVHQIPFRSFVANSYLLNNQFRYKASCLKFKELRLDYNFLKHVIRLLTLPVLIPIWKYLSSSRLFKTQYIELKEQPSASLIWPRMQQHCIPDCICWHFQCNSMSAFFMISSLASVLLAWGLRMTSQNIQINFCRLPYTHLHLELGEI